MTEEVAGAVTQDVAPAADTQQGAGKADAAPATPAGGKPVDTKAEGTETEQTQEQTAEQKAQAEENRARNHRQREINRATKRYYEEKAKREFLEQRLAELAPKDTGQQAGAPKLEQFSDIEEYAKAVGKYEREQAVKEYETKKQKETENAHRQRVISSWEEKVSAAEERYEDFDSNLSMLTPDTPMDAAIMDSDNGADIAYFLFKNKAEFARISKLSTLAQVREIGKLEAKLSAEPPKPITPSKAPAPISPVGGNKGASNDEPSDKDDINTWMRKENARMKKLAGRA